MNARSARRRQNGSARRRPLLVETLEGRRMLSVSVLRGAVIVEGTSGDDVITITMDKVTPGRLDVTVNDATKAVDLSGVSRVNVSALEGNDLIFVDQSNGAISLPFNIAGGSGNDTMTGGSASDVLQGGRGDDVIMGNGGADLLEGHAGNDALYGGDGRDTLEGDAGGDALYTGGSRRESIVYDKSDLVDTSVPAAKPPIHIAAPEQPNFFNDTPFPFALTPAQVRTIYGIDSLGLDGTGQTIAIVDAYDDPTVRNDLNVFSDEYGLPEVSKDSFQVYYATKRRPNYDSGWAGEISLDVQWAHAIAPQAKIILVEANSAFPEDLNQAIDRAVELVHPTGGVISMSFGLGEQQTDTLNELRFHNPNTANISFVAATGDSGAMVGAPAVSPFVTAVGGTFLNVAQGGTTLITPEEGWTGSSGGISSFFPRPDFQTGLKVLGAPLNNRRSIPDVSFLADPRSGVSVFGSSPDVTGFSGWTVVGGTSLASPMFAAFVALANQKRAQMGKDVIGENLNPAIYNAANTDYAGNFTDITTGANGFHTGVGYDNVTGLGTPKTALVTALANDNTATFTSSVSFSARLTNSVGASGRPAPQTIFGGTGSAANGGNTWDLTFIPSSASNITITTDGPLTLGSDGFFTGTGVITNVISSKVTESSLVRFSAREVDGNLVGEMYAVSSRGKVLYVGNKAAFYGTFTTSV